MVSYIQSCYEGFGSGIVIDGYGISKQEPGLSFTIDENPPNCSSQKTPLSHHHTAFLSRTATIGLWA
jgi:gamma-glutamyltranspeptidase/glutathione hydrolase